MLKEEPGRLQVHYTQSVLHTDDAWVSRASTRDIPVSPYARGAQVEVKQRQSESLGSPMQPYSGDWAINIPTEWNRDGRLFVKQVYPLPVTVLDLIPEVALGD